MASERDGTDVKGGVIGEGEGGTGESRRGRVTDGGSVEGRDLANRQNRQDLYSGRSQRSSHEGIPLVGHLGI